MISRKCKINKIIFSLLVLLFISGCNLIENKQSKALENKNKIDKLIQSGDYDGAYIELSNIIDSREADSNTKVSLGWVYNYQKRFSDAETILREAIKESPNSSEGHFALGIVYKNQQNYSLALKELDQAKKLNLNNDKIYAALGDIYLSVNKNNLAEDSFKKALSLKPKDFQYYLSLSEVYFREGNYSEAIMSCQKAYDLSPVDNKERIAQSLESLKLRAILKTSK